MQEHRPWSIGTLLPKSAFARSVSLLAGWTALGQALSMATAPILSRLYTAQDFGNLQLFQSLLQFVISVAAWRYELAIVLADAEDAATDVIGLCFGAVLMTAILASVGVWGFQEIGYLRSFNEIRSFLWLLVVAIIGSGMYLVLTQWQLRKKQFRRIAHTRFTQSVWQVGMQVGGGVLGLGALGLVLGDVAARLSGAFSLARLALKEDGFAAKKTSLQAIKAAATRYHRFPLWSGTSSLVNVAGFALPPLLLGNLFGSAVLGMYALVERLMNAPVVFIGVAVSQVYTAEAGRLRTDAPQAWRRLYVGTAGKFALIGLVPALIMMVTGPEFFAFVLGAPWREAGVYAQAMTVAAYCNFIIWPLLPTLNLLERQDLQLYWDTGRLILVVAVIAIGHVTAANARVVVAALAGAYSAGYIGYFWLAHRALARHVTQSGASAAILDVGD